jgi:type IV pilus assembly protein PilM
MPSSNICWGIEVGAGGVKALKLEATGEGVRVLDFMVIPHKKVLSTPGIDQNDATRVALGQFVSQVDLTGTAVAVSVPGHSAFARFAKLPPVEPKKVPDIVKFEAVQQIPFPIEQVEWDYQTFQAPDSPEVEVGIFAITRDRILEKLALYQDVGIVPDYVTLSPVAAYNAMAYDLAFTEKTPGTIVLDIGTTSTDLIIAESGRVWIRTFPIGGHHFTEALVNAFQLSYPKAEKLKREAESSKHARHIFQAMRPVFGDLAQDVQRSIGYYQSLHKEARLERLVGLGSTFRLPGLRKYLKQQVGMDVFRMEQFKRLSLDGPRAGEFQAQTLALGTAYGLALQGVGMSTLEANLMPVQVIRDAMWQRKVKWFGIAAGIAVAASVAMFIRPFLDDTEVSNNPPPTIVRNVINDANALKSAAQDVTNPAIENAAAGEVLNLVDGRDIFAHIVNDVGEMVAFAQGRASKPDQAALEVKKLSTAYQPPGVGLDDPFGAAPLAPREGEVGDGEIDLTNQPRILITLNATTTEPDAMRFAINNVRGWLERNAKREGVPYQIKVTAAPRVTLGEAAAGPGGSLTTGSPTSMTTSPRQPAGQLVGGPAPGRGMMAPPQLMPQGTVAGEGSPMGAAIPGMGSPGSQPVAGADDVKKLAPLPTAPEPEAGTRTSTLTMTWEAILLPKASKGGQP